MTPSLMSNNDPVESPEPCGMSLDELKHLSDESLMVHLQAGHADVLSIIFDRHYRLVLSVAMKILRDVGEAEDLMHPPKICLCSKILVCRLSSFRAFI